MEFGLTLVEIRFCSNVFSNMCKGVSRKFSRGREATKIALFSLFQEGGNGKKDRKIALLSLYLLYLYPV